MRQPHRITTAALAALVLSSCMPLETYYKPGATLTRTERDQTTCDIRALRDAPVATQVRQTAPVFYPPRRVCDAASNCTTTGGFWEPGMVYTVDVNADLRDRIQRQCMADRGYAPLRLPPCRAEIARATPPGRTTVFPRLTENACVIRNSDGSWQIVP